jgi:NAD(P)-dependent dehydrogenase (short-subunit alcohol dehydrogenase family)
MPETVVVTGAGAGLGRAIVHSFARRGAAIGMIARGRERLEDAQREVEQLGGRALLIVGDIADPATSEAAATQVEEAFGPIDVWVNNAMATVFSPVAEMTPDDYRRVTEVTYLGFVYGTLAALKRMKPRDHGTIVQIGSALAYRSIPLQSAYCGAKHALVGFTDSLRTELTHDHSRVHVTVVHMPAINTPQFGWSKSRMPRQAQPVPPIFQPEACAEAVHWAAHQRHREVLVGGPTLMAIVGQRLAPGYADAVAADTWEAQMNDAAEDPHRPNNLYEPVAKPVGAHGAFDARAAYGSVGFRLSYHASALSTMLTRLALRVSRR